MALRNYAEENEEEFYGQGFDENSFVSIWLGLEDDSNDPDGLDVLQDLCGVGYYDLDNQEANCFDFKTVSVSRLLDELSYSETYIDEAIARSKELGIKEAKWVIVQYNFAYKPDKVNRVISPDPVFVGVFAYSDVGL